MASTTLEVAILTARLICASPTPEAHAVCAERLPKACADVIRALGHFDTAPRVAQEGFSKSQLLDIAALRRFRVALCDTE